jgi:hypothetical protein
MLQRAVRGAVMGALFVCSPFLAGCATDQPQWMDHTALLIHPSRHQALLAFSFGAEAPREDSAVRSRRSIAAAIAAAAVVQDEAAPALERIDFKNGRLSIHAPRSR